MFGNNVGGEIILASIPLEITSPGGGNEPTINSPGKTIDGDGPTFINNGGGDGPSFINDIGGDSFGITVIGDTTN